MEDEEQGRQDEEYTVEESEGLEKLEGIGNNLFYLPVSGGVGGIDEWEVTLGLQGLITCT